MAVATGITAIGALSLALGVIFITARLLSNAAVFQRLYPDDFACIVGGLLFVAYTGVCIGIDYFAHHNPSSPVGIAGPTYLKLIYNAELLYALTSVAAKLSILLLYRRIFSPSKNLRNAIHITTGLTLLLFLTSISIFSYYCAPNAEQTSWTPSMAATCSKSNTFTLVQGPLDAALNLYILVLPIPNIMRLHLSLKRRLGIVFILMHGVFALVASSVAIYYRVGLWSADLGFQDTGSGDLASQNSSSQALWWRTTALECGILELGMTLVSGSLHACWCYIRGFQSRREAKSLASGGSEWSSSRHRRSALHAATDTSSHPLRTEDATTRAADAVGHEHKSFEAPVRALRGLREFIPDMDDVPHGGINVQTEMTMWVELAKAERGGRDSVIM